MKKLRMIFSILTLGISVSSAFATLANFLNPVKQCLGIIQQESDTKKDLQSLIDSNRGKIIELLTHNPDLQTPLPFTICTKPAPFDIAKSNKNTAIFEHIFRHPSFELQNFVDQRDRTNLFHVTAEYGSTHIMSALFKHCQEKKIDYSSLINSLNSRGKTPLGLAAACCRTKCLKMLLAHGAHHDNQYMPLLHIAASTNTRGEKKRNNTVRALCESGCATHEKDYQGRTARELAQLCTYKSTASCIKVYETKLNNKIEKLHQEAPRSMYFNLLPLPIWEQTIIFLRGPEDAIAPSDQSQPVAS